LAFFWFLHVTAGRIKGWVFAPSQVFFWHAACLFGRIVVTDQETKWEVPSKVGDQKIEMTLFFIDIPRLFYENAKASMVWN